MCCVGRTSDAKVAKTAKAKRAPKALVEAAPTPAITRDGRLVTHELWPLDNRLRRLLLLLFRGWHGRNRLRHRRGLGIGLGIWIVRVASDVDGDCVGVACIRASRIGDYSRFTASPCRAATAKQK